MVLVSHGDTIRVAVAWLQGLPPEDVTWLDVPNGSITSVRLVADSAVQVRTDVPPSSGCTVSRRWVSPR